MSFPYHHVLVVGASSGIGHAMAERLIESGSRVIVVGRRKDKLDAIVRKYGDDKASVVAFDISKIDEIPEFVNNITTAHPGLDCVFLNAGVQSDTDFTQPLSLNTSDFLREINLNFSSFVALTYGFLPFLMAKKSPTSLIYTGSHLGIIPAVSMPAYSASKAALNAFVLCLREQLKKSSSFVKVIELMPPLVQTELHDRWGEERGRNMGMPVKEFVNQAFESFSSGNEEICIGSVGPADVFHDIIDKRRLTFENLATLLRGGRVPGQN